jgi:hypothetical protein
MAFPAVRGFSVRIEKKFNLCGKKFKKKLHFPNFLLRPTGGLEVVREVEAARGNGQGGEANEAQLGSSLAQLVQGLDGKLCCA